MGTVGRRRLLGVLGLLLLFAIPWLLVSRPFGGGEDRETAGKGRRAAGEDEAKPGGTPAVSVPCVGTAEVAASGAPALPPPVDLESVDRERDLHGVVVDDEGKPIAGAALEAERWRPGRGFEGEPHLVPQPEPLRALSAADGSFRFRLEWGEQVDLDVRAEGFGGGKLHDCPAGARIRVVLARSSGGIEILVRDGDGKPIEGATVSVGGGRLTSELMPHAKGTTDAKGLFFCDGLSAGRIEVGAEHPEFGNLGDGIEARIPDSGRERCEVVLDRGRAIEGRVVDHATGLPVAGARVGRNMVLKRAVTTDAFGRFRFLGWNMVGGWHFGNLHCVAPGYARTALDPPPEGPVEFRLVRGFRAEGRVVGADGKPVALAKVEAYGRHRRSPQEVYPRSDLERRASGADGRFALEDLCRDLPYEVSVIAPGHGALRVPLAAPPDGADVVALGDLVLPQGRSVEGVVLDASGKPAREVEVAFPDGGQVRIDDRGRFRIPDVPPGEKRIFVLRPDAFVLLETTVTVPPGADLLDLVLRIPEFRVLVVRVVDPEGRPLRGAEVYAFGEEDNDWKLTGDDGRVVLDQIKEEVVDVSAEMYGPGNRPLRLDAWAEKVRPVGQEITLVMEEGTALSGVVRGVDGKPAARVRVLAACEGLEKERYCEQADESGGFYLRVREALFYDLTATLEDTEGKVLEKGVLRQVSGPKEGVEIRLEPVKE